MDAAQRLSSLPKVKKDSLTSQHLKGLFSHIGVYDAPLPNLCYYTMMLLCFAGFLRFSEACNLKSNEVHFTKTYLKLFISQSKTDMYRDGHDRYYCYLARTKTDTCPVKCLEYYMERYQLSFTVRKIFLGQQLITNQNTVTAWERLIGQLVTPQQETNWLECTRL